MFNDIFLLKIILSINFYSTVYYQSQAWKDLLLARINFLFIIIGPESDHCLPLSLTDSLTHSLTNSCLVNLIEVTLQFEDANSKLVELVTAADVDAQKRVDNSLVQVWKLKFGPKIIFFSRLKVWSRF